MVDRFLLAFSIAMMVVGISKVLHAEAGDMDIGINPQLAPRLIPTGFSIGTARDF
jgi:hypothetical protein